MSQKVLVKGQGCRHSAEGVYYLNMAPFLVFLDPMRFFYPHCHVSCPTLDRVISPPQLLAKVERLAKQDNRNKSELLREALRRYIEEREWRDVLKYAKKKSIQQEIFREEDIEQIVDEVRQKGSRA